MVGGLVQIIALLNSKEMVIELFNAYAPNLNIAEMKLGRSTKQRAEILFARLDEFAEQNPAEHTALFKILNTIAAVNSDNSNHKAIMGYLDHHAALRKEYNSLHYTEIFGNRSTLAMMAAFVAVQAQSGDEQVQKEAKDLWQSLQVAASKTEQGNFTHKNITPPTFTAAQMSRGLQTFRDELEKYIRTSNQQKDYIAFVIPSMTSEGFVRYYVNTSPPARDVLKVQNGQPVIGADTNMTGFEIRHYYARDKAWISETKSGDPEYILDLFLRHVLGSQVERQKRRHCEHKLPLFKYPERFSKEITLPESSKKSGEKVWISEMEIQVTDDVTDSSFELKPEGDDVYLPTVFRGTEIFPIHSQMMRQLKEKFDRKNWKVLRVELKAKLHPYAYDDNLESKGEITDFAEVTFPIKPGGCTPRVEARYKNDRELRNKALELRANWGLAGLTDEQYNLLSQAERDGEI